ncbi:Dipeptide transport system permease protein DppB [Luteitalea pratensis]|uniref:Dipeptide transport system permease protein DppB n=1 Tax=Luteitalea pratensis TaxID=1855912 RepID=A0A143PRQ8_LUTPR|nr:ABC transporter permease [Luteitalea pratensis]AMY10509.1 Dipeptide transport system permease protein DppB [Luteitalea pratensis]
MLRFLTRRLLLTVPVLLGVATLVFALIHLVPGDPAVSMLGEAATPADVSALRARLGLDDPLPTQYGRFLSDAVRGRLGQSLRTGRPVTTELSEKLGATVLLAVTAMIVALVVAVPLGIIAAVRADTWVDNVAMALALVGVSMPNFWLGPLLALLFGVYLGWLPISGRGPSAEFLIGSVPRVPPAYLVLPALTLGLALAAILARMTRASLVEELKELYVRAARSRGLSTRRTVLRHALRNGLIPIITIVGLQFGAVLTGTIITETIFAWPGLGRLLIQSIQFRDYPMVQGCILLIAVTYVAVNLLTDLAYGLADPRIRYE